jgi:N-acetylmuramoyl-L-alanine amidase
MKIAIDPGHGQDNATNGLYDSGAVGKLDGHKYEEATIALAYALKLRDKLEAGGHEVFMTRDDASDSAPVGRRAQRAKDAGCEMFISLHLNSFEKTSANGVEVEYRSTTKDMPLADALLAKLLAVTKLGDHHNDQRLDLAVLKFTAGPAVLIELGFITNEKDLRTLLDEKMQGKIVEAIAEVATRKKVAPTPAKPVTVASPNKMKATETFAELGKHSEIALGILEYFHQRSNATYVTNSPQNIHHATTDGCSEIGRVRIDCKEDWLHRRASYANQDRGCPVLNRLALVLQGLDHRSDRRLPDLDKHVVQGVAQAGIRQAPSELEECDTSQSDERRAGGNADLRFIVSDQVDERRYGGLVAAVGESAGRERASLWSRVL